MIPASSARAPGLSAEELRPSELEHNDRDFPLVACARVRRPRRETRRPRMARERGTPA
jgi:hypothetical protein